MDSLLNTLRNKGKELSKQPIKYIGVYDYLKEFLNQYDAYNINTYSNITRTSYLGAVLLASEVNMDYDELLEHLKNLQLTIDYADIDGELFNNYFEVLNQLYKLGVLDNNSLTAKGLDDKASKIFSKFKELDRLLFTTPENSIYDYEASKSMIALFKTLPDPLQFGSFTELNNIHSFVKTDYEDFANKIKKEHNSRIANRTIKKYEQSVTRNILINHVNDEHYLIFGLYDKIKKYYNFVFSEVDKQVKTLNKQISNLANLDSKLSTYPKKILIKIGKEWDKLLINSEIEYEYLLYALKHNFNIQSVAETKNKEYSNNSFTKMDILFSKYNFSFNIFSEAMQNEIIKIGVEKVEEILKQVKYSDLNFISEYSYLFFDVMMHSNVKILKIIDSCFKNKFITKEFILSNNKMLFDVEVFNRFFNNINLLINLGIDLSSKNAQDILLLNSNQLAFQLDILNEYKIKLSDENFSNFELFKNSKLLDYIDNFIELGYCETVISNPRYLNSNSEDIIKRIMIANLIGMPAINNKKKFVGPITTGNNFYVDPSKYDNFSIDYKEDYQNSICLEVLNNNPRNVINVSTKNMPMIKALDDNFMKDSFCYVIDGVIISRKRVMRNLEVLTKNIETMDIPMNDLLFQSILYNMINNIEPEKLEEIYNSISKMEIDRPKTYKFN